MEIKKATFIVSNSDYRKCPDTKLPEYAFIGRSNVGKSSLINMLTRNKSLAKTSVKPGKTQLINHFLINDQWYLVDLPGYGYARTSKNSRQLFQKMITDYILHRETLINVFVLIDSRIPPQNPMPSTPFSLPSPKLGNPSPSTSSPPPSPPSAATTFCPTSTKSTTP